MNLLENLFVLLGQPIFWLVILFVFWQYRRGLQVEKKLLGCLVNSPLEQLILSIFYGIIGGFLGSLILVTLRVSLTDLGINYLWPIALILMLIRPRFLCLAYGGAILGLIHLLGYFPSLNLVSLLYLIGALHIVESLLIYLNGYQGASPIFIRHGLDRVIGAFNIYKIWPIPLVAFMTAGESSYLPIVAALGYQDLALARSPRERSCLSARNLFSYSLGLILLTFLSTYHSYWQFPAALFSFLGHEAVIWKGRKEEWESMPCYLAPQEGVMVLETMPNSLAKKMGLERGDVITRINGNKVNTKSQLSTFLQNSLPWVDLEIRKIKGMKKRKRICSSSQQLGVILVPDSQTTGPYVEITKRKFPLWN